jgi:hypothetical protein
VQIRVIDVIIKLYSAWVKWWPLGGGLRNVGSGVFVSFSDLPA